MPAGNRDTTHDLGPGIRRRLDQRLVEGEPRETAGAERKWCSSSLAAGGERQPLDPRRPKGRGVDVEIGEEFQRLGAEEVTTHLESSRARPLQHDDAGAVTCKFECEGSRGQSPADSNCVGFPHGPKLAHVRPAGSRGARACLTCFPPASYIPRVAGNGAE